MVRLQHFRFSGTGLRPHQHDRGRCDRRRLGLQQESGPIHDGGLQRHRQHPQHSADFRHRADHVRFLLDDGFRLDHHRLDRNRLLYPHPGHHHPRPGVQPGFPVPGYTHHPHRIEEYSALHDLRHRDPGRGGNPLLYFL